MIAESTDNEEKHTRKRRVKIERKMLKWIESVKDE